MVLQRADSIVRTMLSDTILALCRNTLSYEGEVCIEGLLGITVDQKEVFLVHLNETIQKEGFSPTKSLKRKTVDVPSKESGDDSQQSSQGSESESQDFSQTPTKRKRRRKRRSKDKPNFDKDGIEGNLDAYSDKLDISQEQKPCDIENDDADSHLSAEVKKEDSHSGEEELVFVKEEPSDVYEQSVFSLPGASQPAESSQLYQQNDAVPIGQLQELAFQLSGDISQTQHNIPQTPALSSQSAGGTTEQASYKVILKNQQALLLNQEMQLTLLQQLVKRNGLENVDIIDDLLEKPCDSREELRELDKKLADDTAYRTNTIALMTTVSGRNANETTRRMLSKIGTNKLWSEYSLKGAKQKESFQSVTTVYQVLLKTCAKCHPGVRHVEVEEAIGEYLKHAPNKKGGTRYKKPMSANQQNIQDMQEEALEGTAPSE